MPMTKEYVQPKYRSNIVLPTDERKEIELPRCESDDITKSILYCKLQPNGKLMQFDMQTQTRTLPADICENFIYIGYGIEYSCNGFLNEKGTTAHFWIRNGNKK